MVPARTVNGSNFALNAENLNKFRATSTRGALQLFRHRGSHSYDISRPHNLTRLQHFRLQKKNVSWLVGWLFIFNLTIHMAT